MSGVTKTNIDDWQTREKLIVLQGWARDGLTMEQIAHNMGISKVTLYDWMKKSSNILNVLKNGREVVIYALENKLINKALSGDVACLIFALKNMRPDKWREKHDIAYETTDKFIEAVASVSEQQNKSTHNTNSALQE